MKNKYIRRSKLSEAKFRELLRCFCLDLDAVQIAAMVRLNRNTINRYLRLIRQRISDICKINAPFGNREAFKSRLAGFRIPNSPEKRKTATTAPPVFGAVERGGKVFTEILPKPFQGALKSSLSRGLRLGGSAHALRFRGYRVLMFFGCARPYSLADDRPFSFFDQADRTEPLWLFWLYARKRLSKFQGIPKSTFDLHLKECEFRFNTRGRDIYTMLMAEFRKRPLCQSDAVPDSGREKGSIEAFEREGDAAMGEFSYGYFPEDALRNLSEA